jgi:plastocyanin
MTAKRFTFTVVLTVVPLALAGCGGGGGSPYSAGTTSTTTATNNATTTPANSSGNTLNGSVGPGFSISLTQDSQAVKTLAPGAYTLVVNDQANIHNFHLTGTGVDVRTDVAFTGTKTFKITLKDGSYHYQCDAHPSTLNGDFTISG